MNALTTQARALTFGSREIAHGWRWRDRQGQLHAPADMPTRHLFFTFRMIWNNHMPEAAWVGEVRLYRFGPSYTPDYMRDAVVAVGRELLKRDDLDPAWADQLARMAAWFADFETVDTPAQVEAPRRLLR